MNNQTKQIRRAILNLINANPGSTINQIVDHTLSKLKEDVTAGDVRKQIESLIENQNIVVRKSIRGSRTFKYHSLPTLFYKGKRVTQRELVAHQDNIYGLNLASIQKRLKSGLSAEETLAVPRSGKCKLLNELYQYRTNVIERSDTKKSP